MTDELTRGEWWADKLARVFASWYFVTVMLVFSAFWIILNIYWQGAPDSHFERFNLVVSIFTLFIDLCIIMNQIRQAMLDRQMMNKILSIEADICIHIEGLHSRLDRMYGPARGSNGRFTTKTDR